MLFVYGCIAFISRSFSRKNLYEVSKIHNSHLMCHQLNQCNIMTDKTKCNILFSLKLCNQFNYGFLNRNIES